MEKELVIKNEDGKEITISVVGEFKVPELEKEYVIYSVVDNDDNNDIGHILIGEVERSEDGIKVLGIKEDEKDLVLAFYNEISSQVGEE